MIIIIVTIIVVVIIIIKISALDPWSCHPLMSAPRKPYLAKTPRPLRARSGGQHMDNIFEPNADLEEY